jgi:hypothetical protein
METKHPLKSKTILFSLVTIIVAILNITGFGDQPTGQMTWKELSESQSNKTEQVTDLLVLLGGGGAVYGRMKAKSKIGGRGDE